MQKHVEMQKRIEGVAGIRQVCQTMATVSSARLSKTRDRALGLRTYTGRLREIVAHQQRYSTARGEHLEECSAYLGERSGRHIVLWAIAGDRGLCGGYNLAIARAARDFCEERLAGGVYVQVEALGGKIARYLGRYCAAPIVGQSEWPSAGVTDELAERMLARFSQVYEFDPEVEVWCAFTEFISPVQRETRLVRLLPLAIQASEDEPPEHWFYEPNAPRVLSHAAERLARSQIEDVLLESYASEQAARMVTMEEAAERADKMLADLIVQSNRMRRESITGDLLGVLVSRRVAKEVMSDVARV
jgi:F-type H+-transporting ATPase subunit gamma